MEDAWVRNQLQPLAGQVLTLPEVAQRLKTAYSTTRERAAAGALPGAFNATPEKPKPTWRVRAIEFEAATQSWWKPPEESFAAFAQRIGLVLVVVNVRP